MTTHRPRIQLTDRDLVILQRLADLRFLSIPQVAAMHFPSVDAAATRLRRLFQAKLVVRLFQAALTDDPHTMTVYGLSRSGAKVLAAHHDGIVPPHLSEGDTRSGLFLTHTLHRNDIPLSLERLAQQEPEFSLTQWTHAPEEVRASALVRVGRDEEIVTIVPDGFFIARWQNIASANAVEVDMGTVRLERMLKRYQAYHSWWRRGGAAARYGSVPYRVLTVTNSERRLAALRRVASLAPSGTTGGSGLFWFALLSVSNPAMPEIWFKPVWTTGRRPTGPPVSLFPRTTPNS